MIIDTKHETRDVTRQCNIVGLEKFVFFNAVFFT